MKQLIEDLISAMEYHVEQTRPVHETTVAIQAAKDALKAMDATPPAAPVQEPVAVVSGYYGGQCVVLPTNPARLFNAGTAFYTTPPAAQPAPVQEPDLSGLKPEMQETIRGWIVDGTFVERALGALHEQERENMRLEKLVAAQRQWVGLTDEQVEKLFRRWCKNNAYTTTLVEFKKAYCYIDAELREKNGGAA
jgi:hypothetical protein